MALDFKKNTYPEIFEKLERVDHWLKSIKLKVEKTRFEVLVKNMFRISQSYQEDTLPDLCKEMGEETIITTLVDSAPFIRIYNAFANDASLTPRTSLEIAISPKAPFMATDENGACATNHARNILFELELAARLKSQGVKIIGLDDVWFEFGNARYNVQCKRPMRKNRLNENIDEAIAQLRKRLNASDEKHNPRGIIAIAVDKIVGADKGFIRAKADNDLERELLRKLENFVKRYSHLWAVGRIDIRVVGCIIFLKYVAYVESTGVMSEGTQIYFDILAHPTIQAKDSGRLKDLGDLLKSTPPL